MKIIKIISVVDTRDWVEIEDKWHAVPGSGESHNCARCGREHEIHATVELADGSWAVVGVGCAREAEIQPNLKAETSAAKTRARNQAKLIAYQAEAQRLQALIEQVETYPLPEVERATGTLQVGRNKGQSYQKLVMGSVSVWLGDDHSDQKIEERTKDLIHSWRDDQVRKQGGSRNKLYTLRDQIKKLERKLA